MTEPAASLTVAFAGTPQFAVPSLEALLASHHRVSGVWCQPDRPAGRGRKLRQCPVKTHALKHDLTVHQPRTLRDEGARVELAGAKADVLVVAAYGLILPPEVLLVPRLGCINVHASLLPRWRGAAPIQRAILAGDARTGVSIMRMEEGLDTGPVYDWTELRIGIDETAGELQHRLADLGAATLVTVLDRIAAGPAVTQAQPASGACYAAKLEKSEARLDWNRSAAELERQVRAFNPWPVASTEHDGRTVRIWRAHAEDEPTGQMPGQILREDRDGIAVACGTGSLLITELQLPGRRPVSVEAFLNGHSLVGETLG